MITGGLIIQHNIVTHGNAHEVVAAGGGQQNGKVFQVVLIGFHVVGIADVNTHGNTGQFTHEMVFQTGTGDLFASGLVAAIYAERPLTQAVEFAGRLVADAMRITPDQPDYRLRGVSFETVLSDVTDLIR